MVVNYGLSDLSSRRVKVDLRNLKCLKRKVVIKLLSHPITYSQPLSNFLRFSPWLLIANFNEGSYYIKRRLYELTRSNDFCSSTSNFFMMINRIFFQGDEWLLDFFFFFLSFFFLPFFFSLKLKQFTQDYNWTFASNFHKFC